MLKRHLTLSCRLSLPGVMSLAFVLFGMPCDCYLQMEKDKQNSALAAFNAKKQEMIEAEKAKIRSLVRTSVSK